MGMPCQVNSILKLSRDQYPAVLEQGAQHQVTKSGYRILPLDVPLALVNADWVAHADIVVRRLQWEGGQTTLWFEVQRLYLTPFPVKE